MKRVYPKAYTTDLPPQLDVVGPLPTPKELEAANAVRGPFLFPNERLPYMNDVVRAMRLVRGRRRYVEVGTYDKGCLAYVSGLLSTDALLVDVDIEAREDHTRRLRSALRPGQKLETVVGDSGTDETLDRVKSALKGEPADAIFIDGNHSAAYVWSDYARFSELLAPGGVLLFHDIYWQGEGKTLGSAEAMGWIDRQDPVYVSYAEDPVHRFFPCFWSEPAVWGGVGIILR